MEAHRKELTSKSQFMSSLDEHLKKIAQTELGETDLVRTQCLEALRNWISKNGRILSIRCDDSFLLRFLRAKKFQLMQSQDCIERYLLLRQIYHCSVFQEFDIRNNIIAELIDRGCVFPLLQRDKLGRRVMFVRPGSFDIDKFTQVDLLKLIGITFETLMESEDVQVRGISYIVDAGGINLSVVAFFSPREAVRLVKNAEKIVPMRHKQVDAFNINSILKFLVDFGMSLLSEKMKNRISFHTNIDELEHISTEALPKEYGGKIPMREMIEKWKEEIISVQPRVLLNDKMRVNPELYSTKAKEGAVRALHTPLDYCESNDEMLAGCNGTFKKLEID